MSYAVLDMHQSPIILGFGIDRYWYCRYPVIDDECEGVVYWCGYGCWQRRKGFSATAPNTLSLTSTLTLTPIHGSG